MEIRKIKMCIPVCADLCILKISKIKRIEIYIFVSISLYIFVSISFHNLVRSIHPTTCRSMFSEANACARVAGSGENCCELAGSLLYNLRSPEQFEKMPCLSEGYELSVAIDKNVYKKRNWKWIQEVGAVGVSFRHWC